MIFASLLAGGTGTRMEKHNIPKQFIELNGKPIIIRTIEKILSVADFDYLYIAIHPNYETFLREILAKHDLASNKKIVIIHGGKERIDSVQNVIDAISKKSTNENDIIVMHDAVRPFVSKEILLNSIKTASEFGACVATVPAVDTMYILDNEGFITGFPNRQTLFNGQAPDSFKIGVIKNALNSLTDEERKVITGTVQICAAKGYKIQTIAGEYKNIKITTENDLTLAIGILKEEGENESLCTRS